MKRTMEIPYAPIPVHSRDGKVRVVVDANSRRHARKLAKVVPANKWEKV